MNNFKNGVKLLQVFKYLLIKHKAIFYILTNILIDMNNITILFIFMLKF